MAFRKDLELHIIFNGMRVVSEPIQLTFWDFNVTVPNFLLHKCFTSASALCVALELPQIYLYNLHVGDRLISKSVCLKILLHEVSL
jgi:hypothetical protein